MKKFFLFALIVLLNHLVQAQWTDSGTNLTTSDNVGIGTTSPEYKLDVSGDARISNYLHVKGGRLYVYRDSDKWGVVYSKHFDSPASQPLHLNYYGSGTTIIGSGAVI